MLHSLNKASQTQLISLSFYASLVEQSTSYLTLYHHQRCYNYNLIHYQR